VSARLPEVTIGEDAIERLAVLLDSGPRGALLVMDPNTEEALGARVARELRARGIFVDQILFGGRSGQSASEDSVWHVRRRIDDSVWPVAVGSGSITDIVRYAAHESDRDFVSVPTAASMDGYASGVAALQRHGVKVTLPARPPVAIFADPRVVAEAPVELTRAGIGDLLAKATAGVDWLAAHLLVGEPFDPDAAERVREPLALVSGDVQTLMSGGVEPARQLLEGLIESGIAMAIVGSSRPASGWEHHASHFWDLLAARGMRPHGRHGLQVGHAMRFAMRLQRFAFGGGLRELRTPIAPADPLGPQAREWLGEPTQEIVEAVEQKQRLHQSPPATWPRDEAAWSSVCARLGDALATFDEVERALDEAEIFLDVDERTLRATLRFATRLRARYTVVDLLEGQELLEDAIDAVLDG